MLLAERWTEHVEVPKRRCFGSLSDGFERPKIEKGGVKDAPFLDSAESEELDPRRWLLIC